MIGFGCAGGRRAGFCDSKNHTEAFDSSFSMFLENSSLFDGKGMYDARICKLPLYVLIISQDFGS